MEVFNLLGVIRDYLLFIKSFYIALQGSVQHAREDRDAGLLGSQECHRRERDPGPGIARRNLPARQSDVTSDLCGWHESG